VAENGLSSRIRFKAGNFFQDQLPDADVIVLGRVLHNWDVNTKRMLLAKASESVRANGAVIVYDMLIDDVSFGME
jgi:chemotaxis methyl-accepting protein methylase